MDKHTINTYENKAKDYSLRWKKEESGISSLLPHLFSRDEKILDIGFGSGYDLSVMKNLGMDVCGIEPSENFIASAIQSYPELKDCLIKGSLPDNIPQSLNSYFDGILLVDVIMLIHDEDLFQCAYRIRDLLKIGGKLVISIPLEIEDIATEANSNIDNQLVTLRPICRIQLLFERLGFQNTSRWESSDSIGINEIKRSTLVFKYIEASVSESVDKIESIINRDKKTATYKLALLKALCDIAQFETGSVTWNNDFKVSVPIDSIVNKWIKYYWPIVSSKYFIPQIRGEHKTYQKHISFRKSLSELADLYSYKGGLPQYLYDSSNNSIHPDAFYILKIVKNKIRSAIIKGPVFYAGGGSNTEKPFVYDNRKNAIIFNSDIWREFVLLGHWITDSINLRWADLTRELSNNNLKLYEIIPLIMVKPETERNTSAVRQLYIKHSDLECVWTEKHLNGKFDVDHVIPFVLRHDNSLWNLLPVHPKVNNQKRDKLPSKQLIEMRRDRIIFYWEMLNENMPEMFKSDFIRFTGKESFFADNWKKILFWSFSEAIESTASRRGIERWEPKTNYEQ